MPATLPATIRATVHEDAINKASRLFNATPSQTLNELFQNARRANATAVRVTIDNGIVSVQDDGDGIPNPADLLAFGHSGWDENTARREDPAGMGIFSLSRYSRVTISTVCKNDGPAWTTTLEPDHFLGKFDAAVEIIPHDKPAGTTVSFTSSDTEPQHVGKAALHFPLPVTCNEDAMQQQDFLHDAERVEEWEGIRFGVYRSHLPFHTASWINFHGVTTDNMISRLPQAPDIDRRNWHVKADIVDCPRLELALPARAEPIKTPFLEDVRQAASRAIYRAMLDSPQPVEVPFHTHADALKLGIRLPEPKPWLQPWAPEPAYAYWTGDHRNPPREPLPPNALVMDPLMEIPDQHALYHALRSAAIDHRFYRANSDFSGFGWYDRLPRVVEASVSFDLEGHTCSDDDQANPRNNCRNGRAESITYSLTVTEDDRQRKIEIPGQVAFTSNEDTSPYDATLVVAQDADLDPEALTKLLMDAWFDPSDDHEADSYDTQHDDQLRHFTALSISLLRSKDESIVATIRDLVGQRLTSYLPKGRSATITISSDRTIGVELNP